MSKGDPGRFFEDFQLGQVIAHPGPRTVTTGDVAMYAALHGPRFALFGADPFARACGFDRAPVDPWLVFHIVFGKSVPDISLNAVANLGYAEGRFLAPVLPGDTLSAASEVIGLRATSNGQAGVVYVRTTGRNQAGERVLDYVRWVLVRKRDPAARSSAGHVPALADAVPAGELTLPGALSFAAYDFAASGSGHAWEDYAVAERIDHLDGMAVEEAEHQLATRLYGNTARVHFNAWERSQDPSGRRLVYGGVVISAAKALSFNGLENAGLVLAVNGGRHVNPVYAGRTLFAWSEVLDKAALRDDVGALRLRLVATADRPCADFPDRDAEGRYPPEVVLDLDYWAAIPRRLDG